MDEPLKPSQQLFSKLRAYFFAGILVLAPISITIWFAVGMIEFIDHQILPLLPDSLNPDYYVRNILGYSTGIPGLGVIILLIGVTLIGALATGFIGSWMIATGENLMDRTPLLRSYISFG